MIVTALTRAIPCWVGKPNYGEVKMDWSHRKQFRRQYVQRALEAIGANADGNVGNVLTEMDWLHI